MKRRIILAGLAVLGGALVFLWLKPFSSPKEERVEGLASARIERGSIQVTVACTGKVVSNQDVEIKSKASGEIKKLPFDVSDPVRAGDLLVELDPSDEQRNLEKAQAALDAATSQLNNARQDLAIAENQLLTTKLNIEAEISSAKATWEDAENKARREEQLYRKKLSSQEMMDSQRAEAARAKAAYEKALVKQEELKTKEMELELRRQAVRLEESRVRAAKVDLEIAKQRLADTRILSPMNGIVTARDVQIGQIISSGINNIGGGTTILTISDLSRIFVIASVDESDIGKIKLGQKAKITVDSYPDELFSGQVVQIATRGVNISNVVTFEVKIEVVGKNKSLLKPEMTANVQIIAMEKAGVLLIPNEAVEFSSEGPKAQVIWPDGKIESRSLTLGLDNGEVAEVIAGLREGEKVCLHSGQVQSRWSKSGKYSSSSSQGEQHKGEQQSERDGFAAFRRRSKGE